MASKLEELLRRVGDAERELDQATTAWRNEARQVRAEAVRFSGKVRAEQRQLRRKLLEHIASIGILFWLTAPVIYSLIIPLLLIDLLATLYQWVCFPVYEIKRVRRSDFVVLDRHRLSYLNAIEKLNCLYCGYANGVIAYARELASRTEQYFCPIKHALKVSGQHSRYSRFLEYGDAKGFRDTIDQLRKTIDEP